ncbi:GxxExxY protein [Fibrella aestuarina]|uniref:GxxExxY protein n=1 Tax=Fibrella aestuarina TaxID=651143 RepID=UPI0009FC6C04
MVVLFRFIDLLIDEQLVVDLKAVDSLLSIHTAQILKYLRVAKCRFGLLINVNVTQFVNGVKRIANGH